MELGQRVSYLVVASGTPVYSADDEQIGKVTHVLAAEDEDVFDGIVIGEHIFGTEHRFADARQAYEVALRILRNLAQTNPAVYLPNVAATLNNLGVLHSNEREFAEARRALEEARDIYRQLASAAPAAYEGRVRAIERNLGTLPD